MDDLLPTISIIIPTYNSEKVIGSCLRAIMRQNYPKDKFEVIVADNCSKDATVEISKNLGAEVLTVTGQPSQGCVQRNLGAKKAKSEYLLFLDHDMEMSVNLLRDFGRRILAVDCKVDAWYVPEKVIAINPFMSKIRTFERSFYDGTVVDAARIIKKEVFFTTRLYDPLLSSGPADWDMDIQLKEVGCSFGIINECVYHHEDHLPLFTYITKKTRYSLGGQIYKMKWRNNRIVYRKIVSKQYSPSYRLIGIFFENFKWKRVLRNFPEYLVVVLLKLCIGLLYLTKNTG